MTPPLSTVALLTVVGAPRVSAALVIEALAGPCGIPTTFGTMMFAGPIDTTIATDVPGGALVPAAGV